MPTNLRFLMVHNSRTQFLLDISNHSAGKTSYKTWTRMSQRFKKLRKLSTQKELLKWYNIEYGGQTAQNVMMHVRAMRTFPIVLKTGNVSSRSSLKGCKRSEMSECY